MSTTVRQANISERTLRSAAEKVLIGGCFLGHGMGDIYDAIADQLGIDSAAISGDADACKLILSVCKQRTAHLSWSLIHGNPSTPPSDDAVLPHSSARHSAARVLTVYALLVFQTLSRVSRREPSAMTAISARDPKSWPTFCVDETGILVACDHCADDARAPHEAAYCRSLLSCVSMIFSCDE